MNIKKTVFTIMISMIALLFSNICSASSVTVSGKGSTFLINKVSGFDGDDGEKRETVLIAAAQFWADKLVSQVTIEIDANFSSSLYCSAYNATLGSAGPQATYFSTGADEYGLENNVWYPTALVNAYYGSDYYPGDSDISATFNADLGDADCLASSGWYYEMDGNTPDNLIDFYEVLLHELGHGLGFLSLTNSDGSYNSGIVDNFTTFLHDQSTNQDWTVMSSTERVTSTLNTGNVVWSGPEVSALTAELSAGVNAGQVQMYAPNPYESGSSISHFDSALSPDELMEPIYTGNANSDISTALFKDLGWSIFIPNNVPVVTGQSTLSVEEDNSLTLTLSDLTVTDTDNNYPEDFSLTVNSGDNYTVSGTTITPTTDYYGTLTIPVAVNDGEDDSAYYSIAVTVDAINDMPIINSQHTLAIDEDNSVVISSDILTITDPDDNVFTVTLSAGENYTISGTTLTPATNYYGMLTVPLTVNDGDLDSNRFDLTITVNPQNDAPEITATPTVSFEEDNSYAFLISDFTIDDNDSSSFSLQIQSGNNYAVSDNSITPSANFNGTLTVNARVSDGSSYSSSISFNVTVSSVNDNPVITSNGAAESASITLGANSTAVTTVTSSDEDADDNHIFSLSGGSDQSKFTINSRTGLLSFITAPDFESPSDMDNDNVYNVQVTVTDDGVGSLTDTQEIAVTIIESLTVTAPDDITVDATGLFTAVNLGDVIAVDNLGNSLSASVTSMISNGADAIALDSNPNYFRPGVHTLTWSASDEAGVTGTSTQTVYVNPIVNFSKDQIVSEGNAVTVDIILNGDAVTYPVYIPYSVSGTASTDGSDHDLSSGIINIENGQQATFTFSTINDDIDENVESIVITMGTPSDAVKGVNTTHTIELYEGNLAPTVSLDASQMGSDSTLIVVQHEGDVTVSSSVIDANETDTHSFDWSATDSELSDIDFAESSFTFDPTGLTPDLYTLRVTVSDGDKQSDSAITLNVIENTPDLTTSDDSDGDGIDDQSEGFSDSDSDGIANYLDAIAESNLLQSDKNNSTSFLIETEAGLTLTLSEIAFAKDKGQALVTMQDIIDIDGRSDDTSSYNYQSGLFDFNISDLPIAGQSLSIVLPQNNPIPALAVYRKLTSSGWKDFVVDSQNAISSAAGDEGYCPPPGDASYQTGLTEGHWCVQLTIEDGGLNDADNSVNKSIIDPGGVAKQIEQDSEQENDEDIEEQSDTAVASSDGGGGSIPPLWIAIFGLCYTLRLIQRVKIEK